MKKWLSSVVILFLSISAIKAQVFQDTLVQNTPVVVPVEKPVQQIQQPTRKPFAERAKLFAKGLAFTGISLGGLACWIGYTHAKYNTIYTAYNAAVQAQKDLKNHPSIGLRNLMQRPDLDPKNFKPSTSAVLTMVMKSLIVGAALGYTEYHFFIPKAYHYFKEAFA